MASSEGGVGEVAPEDGLDGFDAVPGHSLLSMAEQLVAGAGLKEELAHQLDGLGLEPQGLRRLQHWRLAKAGHELALPEVQGLHEGPSAASLVASEDRSDQRMEVVHALAEVPRKEPWRQLHRDEAVYLTREADGPQRLAALPVESTRAGLVPGHVLARANFRQAREVQAKLDALGMEAASPVEGLADGELVPLEANAQALEVPEQLRPRGPG